MTVKITVLNNGPYKVEGDLGELTVCDATGAAFDLGGKSQAFLCRCGGSTKKPFCDGQHSKIGFQAAEAAVSGQA